MNLTAPLVRTLVGVSLAAAACDGRAPSSPTGNLGTVPTSASDTFTPGLFFAESQGQLSQKIYVTQTNFGALRDLGFRIGAAGMPATVSVTLKSITPRGWLFRSHFAHFSPDPTVKTMDVPGLDHPLDVITAVAVGPGNYMDFSVPIAGTP